MRIIGGSARGKKILPPSDRNTRPALDSLRESIFAVLDDAVEGARVLDLFAGVGAFGLEALSRGARHVTFVDQSYDILRILERNLESLSFRRQSTVLCSDALKTPAPEKLEHPFGLIFIDPPFPFFKEESATTRVFARVKELQSSAATDSSTRIVLRIPKLYRNATPFADAEERKYGQSRIIWLDGID